MKLLERLREMTENYPTKAVTKRTEDDIIQDIQEAKVIGAFYTFWVYQAEYKALTGHFYEVY